MITPSLLSANPGAWHTDMCLPLMVSVKLAETGDTDGEYALTPGVPALCPVLSVPWCLDTACSQKSLVTLGDGPTNRRLTPCPPGEQRGGVSQGGAFGGSRPGCPAGLLGREGGRPLRPRVGVGRSTEVGKRLAGSRILDLHMQPSWR